MRKLRGSRWAAVTACCAVLAAASACSSASAGEPAVARATGASHADRVWVDMAHQANMAEIQAGEFAESNGSNRTIRQIGAVMVRDHQTLDTKLISVANRLKLTLPTSLTLQQTEIGDRLSGEQGAPFDHDFVGSMMTAHDAMIAATQQEITHGSSPEVVALATQALPVLMKHLKMLRSAAPLG
jgi:putative membrane protein